MRLAVGIIIFGAGLILILRHLHVWRIQTDAASAAGLKLFLRRQVRRRILTSGCIAVLGFVIGALHFESYWRRDPSGFTILVSCALALVFMIFVLAMVEFMAVNQLLRDQRRISARDRQELVREYERRFGPQKNQPDDAPPPGKD